MDAKVKAFLESKKQEEILDNEKEKAETLISLGLYEKVYIPEDEETEEEFFSEWDENEGKYKYYIKVPADVTYEEYNEILKYANETKKATTTPQNPIAIVLTVIAWVIFSVGFIMGFVFGNVEVTRGVYHTYTASEFSFAIAFVYWSISFISGIIMLGFAEVIKLLQAIKNKN